MNTSEVLDCPPTVVPVRERIQAGYQQIINSHHFRENHRRVPVTQQYIATCMAAEKNGVVINHPAKELFPNVLCESIVKMVTMICGKYSVTCKADVNDLVQDCFLRITKRIGTFQHQKSMFPTWCWKVCSSTMNSRYRSHLRHASRFVDGEHIENFSGRASSAILAKDITATIREIGEKYPDKKNILFGMFGDPDKEEFCLPTKVKISQVARAVDVEYADAYSFYRNVVQETFKQRFARREA